MNLKGQPCPTTPPGLTCHSALHRRLAVTAGWTPGRCGTCARCAAGTTARAGRRTAPSRLEGPEVGPPRGQRARLPPASKKTRQPRARVPAAWMVGPRARSVLGPLSGSRPPQEAQAGDEVAHHSRLLSASVTQEEHRHGKPAVGCSLLSRWRHLSTGDAMLGTILDFDLFMQEVRSLAKSVEELSPSSLGRSRFLPLTVTSAA